MNKTVSVNEFCERFMDLDGQEVQYVDIGGDSPVPMRARPAHGANALILLFHGAVNRAVRPFPSFLGYRRGVYPHAHQVALADPVVALSERLTTGWFAGSESTPLQQLLPPVLGQLVESIGVSKIIFTGSSAGGLAALYYSWHFPGSTAVVTVPQTNVYVYPRRSREVYLEVAWPKLSASEYRPCLDLRDIYRHGMDNTIVYLQSNLDHHHVRHHMAPFLESIPPADSKRVVLNCAFWGKTGHSGSVPTDVMDAWLRAALMAQNGTAEAIVLAQHDANAVPGHSAERPQSSADRRRGTVEMEDYAARDLQLASQLAAHLLTKGTAEHG